MSKMVSHDPFGYLKHKLWPKERSKIKLPIWFPTIKSRFICVQAACHILLERSWWGLQIFFRLHLNWRFAKKLWASKVIGVPILKISGFHLESLETKWHLDVGPMAKHKEYYKGENDGFLQIWVVVSLMNMCLLVIRLCTKSAVTMH